jgi:SAM-dependent methyltransferase
MMRPVDLTELQTDDPALHELLVCPSCCGSLHRQADSWVCRICGTTFAISDGIPVFVTEGALDHDELDLAAGAGHDNHGRAGHKRSQAAFFDEAALADFEIERPVGSPGLYRFLLTEKFRRSVEALGGRLDGWTALVVCGGSGMDAEFLAGVGASVISSDISLQAAHRVRERVRRHGTPILPIVADVEHLPFADRSVDLVYVHDGLHHLEDPSLGIMEMARVAKRAVCINEPARATATAIGVRLGVALDREEAGNPVARLESAGVGSGLQAAGFRVVHAGRYAMYYHHVPGRLMTLLSGRWLLAATILAWRLANGIIGRVGNKLTIVAVR